jgi:hypothetical protein
MKKDKKIQKVNKTKSELYEKNKQDRQSPGKSD